MFILLTVIPIGIVGTLSYSKAYTEISDSSLKSSILLTDQVKQNLDHLIQETRVFMQIGTLGSSVHFLIQNEETYDEAIQLLHAFDIYKKNYAYSGSIENIYIVNFSGKAISEKRGVFQWTEEESLSSRMDQFKNLSQDITIIPHLSTPDKSRLSIVGKVKRTITKEEIGLVIIDLDASFMKDVVASHKLGTSGRYYIIDKEGNPLFAPRHEIVHLSNQWNQDLFTDKENGHFTMKANNKEWFVVYSTLKDTEWRIVGLAEKADIMSSANEIRNLIFLSVAGSILFTITLYFFITSSLTRPLRELQAKMDLVGEGKLDVQIQNPSQDEIAKLGESFNQMTKQIQILMDKSIEEQIQIKKAELRALQVQINPHFLYNSLDTIIWMAEGQKSEKVIDITKALSHFFRITLSQGKDLITLEDEMAHIQNYLIIQQMRYRDILEVEFDIKPDVLPFHILKLTLQPIVENAIYHGIKNKRGQGLLSIRAKLQQDHNILIEIEDNGIGMTEEKLQTITHRINHPLEGEFPKQGGYGMINVQQRLRLFYGSPYGLRIESKDQEGTKCTILIPAEKKVV